DTDAVFSKPLFDGVIELDVAAIHLPFRAAIYEKSLLNFFKNNGPANIAYFGNGHNVIFNELDNEVNAVSENWFITKLGMIPGSQWPMTKKKTEFLWECETKDKIIEIIDFRLESGGKPNHGYSFEDDENIKASFKVAVTYLARSLDHNILPEDKILFSRLQELLSFSYPGTDLVEHFLKSNQISDASKRNLEKMFDTII
ncbi:hypothetical protein N9E48_08615, partial [Paracoccaceae bacterium]|nr:hypothetical protein [Paracoccaceae bacterium]MDA9990853.1 hypothetical protein [Paracoccaceae bacterium]